MDAHLTAIGRRPWGPRVALVAAEGPAGELRRAIEAEGMLVRVVEDVADPAAIADWQPHVVVLDVVDAGPDLATFVSRVRALHRCACVLIIAEPSGKNLTLAAACNADAVLVHPVDPVALRRSLLHEAVTTKAPARTQVELPALLVGSTPPMRDLWRFVLGAAQSRASVVITGETGTGKQVVARALHRLSARRGGPFVTVNCASLPESLIASELFGYDSGAPGNPRARREGWFGLADGGTLFLDEIADLPLNLQVKLLGILEEQPPEHAGGSESSSIDVRIIAATHRRLEEEVERGRFRADLFYRLSALSTEVPPLRGRAADTLALWEHFVAFAAQAQRRRPPASSPEVMRALLRHDWPGNVRELQNVALQALAVATGDTIVSGSLPAYLSKSPRTISAPTGAQLVGRTLKEIERAAILETYDALGSVRAAAEMLGASERKVHYRLKAYRAEGARTKPAPAELIPRASRERARILLAEDDEALREALTDLLAGEGHEVVALSDGTALLTQVASSMSVAPDDAWPDIIIADVRLPGASGLQVLEKVRTLSCDLPLVLITAFVDRETKERAETLGVTALLTKPLELDRIQDFVRGALLQ